MKHALLALLLTGIAGASIARPASAAVSAEALEQFAKPQRLVQLPDGRRMNIRCSGEGPVTVVLEGGWTVTTLWWRDIQAKISATTRVCSYDRAGYGFSDAGPMPRTATAIAKDLDALLKGAGERGPYVMVAHSLGGLNARLFADRHRDAVVGMLLIDPTVPFQVAKMGAVAPSYRADMEGLTRMVTSCGNGVLSGTIKPDTRESRPCVDPASKSLPETVNAAHRAHQLTPAYQRTAASELQSLDASSREVAASQRSYRSMPLIVMTAGKANLNPDLPAKQQAELDATWHGLHAEVTKLSSRGEHRVLPDSSHMIPKDDPNAVVAAIQELVAEASKRRRQ